VALVALVAGVAPNIIGFLRSVKVMQGGPDLWDALYPYSWFIGFAIAAVVYRQGMRRSRFGAAAA
jgi:NCS1 family nucleobase:cation symporter-1